MLEQWIRDYPADFSVRGTSGALSAFIRQLLKHSHTVTYGSEFLPFIDKVPALSDPETAWAAKAEDFTAESDDSDGAIDDDETESEEPELESPASCPPPIIQDVADVLNSPRLSARERRASLPLAAMSMIKVPYSSNIRNRSESTMNPTNKEILARLQKVAQSLQQYDSEAIAKEITRREVDLFLKIEVR